MAANSSGRRASTPHPTAPPEGAGGAVGDRMTARISARGSAQGLCIFRIAEASEAPDRRMEGRDLWKDLGPEGVRKRPTGHPPHGRGRKIPGRQHIYIGVGQKPAAPPPPWGPRSGPHGVKLASRYPGARAGWVAARNTNFKCNHYFL